MKGTASWGRSTRSSTITDGGAPANPQRFDALPRVQPRQRLGGLEDHRASWLPLPHDRIQASQFEEGFHVKRDSAGRAFPLGELLVVRDGLFPFLHGIPIRVVVRQDHPLGRNEHLAQLGGLGLNVPGCTYPTRGVPTPRPRWLSPPALPGIAWPLLGPRPRSPGRGRPGRDARRAVPNIPAHRRSFPGFAPAARGATNG